MTNKLSIVLFSIFLILAAVGQELYFYGIIEKDIAIKILSAQHKVYGEYFDQRLWRKFQLHGLDKYIDEQLRTNEWSDNQLFQPFINRCEVYSKLLPIVALCIYNSTGNKFIEEHNYQILDSDSITARIKNFIYPSRSEIQSNGMQQVLSKRKQFQDVIHGTDIIKQDGVRLEDRSLFMTYIPIINPETDKLELVLEIYSDVTEDYKTLNNMQIYRYGIILLVVILISILFFISSKKVAGIIDKQHEINLKLTEAKVRAEADNKSKSQFLANVTHELRTPLNAIIGFSEIVKNEPMGPIGNPTYKDYINNIHSSGSHLLGLINDILDFSKAEAEKLVIEMIPVNISKSIKSCITLMEERATQAKVSLGTELPTGSDVIVMADPKRTKQIFLNLLSNAIKFTPEEGKITINLTVDSANNVAHIKVIDTGIGISAKDISKAMSSFGQVDSDLSRKYEGTGLGLPLTKKLVELMDGTFDLFSEESLGTTVSFTLKLQGSETAKSAPDTGSSNNPSVGDNAPSTA